MARTPERYYSPIPHVPERLERLVATFATLCSIEPSEVRISASYRFDDGSSDHRDIAPGAIGLVPIAPPISFVGITHRLTFLYLGVESDRVMVQAEAQSMSLAREIVEKAVTCLGITPYVATRVDNIEKRLDAVQALQQETVVLRCFFSYRFASEDESMASDVLRFLSLQRVEVVTGRSYEPRRVEHVLDRAKGIRAQTAREYSRLACS
ncbi:MAG TPA: hypothetical protein VGR66_07845 [Candidatus Eisenbacteria bacterium]|jgi:hypothetical protein|nr:hypothetical protein [Candidatus Eisenbacteria bacterium]